MTPGPSPDAPMRAALALGGGGARGYAHIGVIQVLEEHGVQIVGIAGSSMGALVGALHATGNLDAYTEWVSSLTQLQVLRLMDVSLAGPGLMRAEDVFSTLHELLGDALIEDLPVPYTAIATDLLVRRPVWFQRGPVETAVRASIALPAVFAPVLLNGRVLVDGGLMDPVPIAPMAAVQADVTIAVDLGGERTGAGRDGTDGAPAKESSLARPVQQRVDSFRRRAASVFEQAAARSLSAPRSGVPRDSDDESLQTDDALSADLRPFDVMNQSLEAMQSVLSRYRLAANPPDVVITVPKDACRTFDFHQATEMIALGRMLAAEALERHPIGPGASRP